MKHNKKRNTGFIYESLVKELTKSIVDSNPIRKEKVVAILKEYFSSGRPLAQELQLYSILLETTNVRSQIAERLLHETKSAHKKLNEKEIFDTQSRIIAAINKSLGKEVWSNFVPNFKTMASVNSIFNSKTPVKQRVLFEQAAVDRMAEKAEGASETLEPIDNIVYRSFIHKFNEKYSLLLQEQKEFLNKFITSFADDGFELKVYLNEEIQRLKRALAEIMEAQDLEPLVEDKAHEVINYLDTFRRREFNQEDLGKVLKTQELVQELRAND
jgi:hypothetical protein